jgi:hypothetical protein
VPAAALLARWFRRRLGLATGLISSAIPAGQGLFVPLAAALIAALGREGDVICLLHYGGQLALDRYLPPGLPRRGLPADFDWQHGYTARYRLEPDDLDTAVAPALAGRRRAWAVLSHADGRGDQLLLDYFDARYPAMLRQDFYGVRIRLWALQPGP